MSESEVSQIQDEDVLRRMWQATEDFGRKKEIRAHMYRLREERLRNLYSPEPTPTLGKDLKELSNAGWNVESEDRTTNDGRTQVKFVNANIEGHYDVEGGRGEFAAVDKQRRSVTEHQDANSSLRRDETRSDTAAHEHVVRRTGDGATVSSTTSSSNTSSKFHQVSSTTHEVPLEDYDSNERVTRISNTNDYDQTLRNSSKAELVSRKVEYPDDSTRVVVETRVLPDGTRVTSTRREFRAPAQSTRSEHHSRSENKSSHHSSHHSSDCRDSSNTTRRTIDNSSQDIVDSQRNADDYDFKRQLREYTDNNDDYSDSHQRHVTKTSRKVTDHSQTENEYSQKHHETKVSSKVIDQSTTNKDDHTQTQRQNIDRRNDNRVDDTDRHHTTTTQDHDYQRNIVKETCRVNDSEERIHNLKRDKMDHEQIIRQDTKETFVKDTRNMSNDRSVPIHRGDIPKSDTPTSDSTYDIPRERTAPVDQPRDIPQKERSPSDKMRDSPRYETVPQEKSHNIPRDRPTTDERVQHINRDTKEEEVIERNTSSEHYQTTYQNDYQTRKVSTDWSPTHQAWASTLRADTPSTTRPSTRASSPGSRTYQSSTSSLRSSVSPDKTYRKPSSRGSSPNKVDRYSPSRTVTSDRYSSTHSTHSVTEERVTKNTSPERKPPTGRSPSRPGYSPDRKPQEGNRKRPSVSPEKKPQSFSDRPNLSPERKPSDGRPRTSSPVSKKDSPKTPTTLRQSPERKPTKPANEYPGSTQNRYSSSPDRKPINSQPNRSSPRSSPDRKNGYHKPTDSNVEKPRTSSPSRPGYPTNDIPRKQSISPDRKFGTQQTPTQNASEPTDNPPRDSPTKRLSVSPDRKPGYMRPTAASQPDDKYRNLSQHDVSDRQSPSKQAPVYSPDQKPQDLKQTSKIKDDHYRFVDEETKMYTQIDKKETSLKKDIYEKVAETDYSRPRNKSTSPDRKFHGEDTPDYCNAPESREMPFNNDKWPKSDTVTVPDNDEQYGRITKTVETIDINTLQNKQTEDITVKRTTKGKEYPKEKTAPNREPIKYGTYDKKKPSKEVEGSVITPTEDAKDVKYSSLPGRDKVSPNKVPGAPTLPNKKTPRDNVSPVKSPIKDTKHKYTTDFISTEKTTEEINKQTTTKDRPRKLVTPSSSPTRKPKPTETEPSTGQSSPTTSVSGFVYFGSPRTEEPITTDLDEFYPDSEMTDETAKRPETLDFKRSPSPSKIPCRSPSPEKHVPTTKDSLPRKSSLKKPTTDYNQASPVEKPPTSFRVSPTDDKPIVTDHNIVKKEQPSEPETGEPISYDKPKPPLQRRETYDDRCKKILGLVDDTTAETITKEIRRYTRKPDASQTSPSISPCDSPAPRESSTFANYPTRTTTIDVTDFISHEKEDLTRTTTTRDQKKTKPQSRETSPAKLQDIITKTTLVTEKRETKFDEDTSTKSVSTKYSSPRQSPDKDFPRDSTQKRPSDSPDRKQVSSPSKPQASKSSPEQKLVDMHPKETSPTRKRPEKTPGYSSTITTETVIVDNIHKTTKNSEPLERTRVLESPEKDIKKSTVRTSLPSKLQPKEGSPVRKTSPPKRDSPEKNPGHIKSATHTTSKIDSHYKTENLDETNVTKIQEKRDSRKVSSPTRQSPRAGSPTIPFQPSDNPEKPETSLEKMPAPAKQTDDKDVPGYMSTTKTTSSKFDQTTISEDIQTTKSNIENKHTSTVPSSRTPTQSKSPQRTPSPTKPSRPNDITIDKKSGKCQPSSPVKENHASKPDGKNPTAPSPTRSTPATIPGYMKTTESKSHKQDTTEFESVTIEDTQEMTTSKTTHKNYSRDSESPLRYTPKLDESAPEHFPTTSPSKPSQASNDMPKRQESPDRKSSYLPKELKNPKPSEIHLKGTKDDKTSYMKTTTATSSKLETTSTTENIEETTSKKVTKKYSSETPTQESPQSSRPRTLSPSKPTEKSTRLSATSPDRKTPKSPMKYTPSPESKHPKHISDRSSSSPEMPSYRKPTESKTSKFETTTITHETEDTYLSDVSKLKSPSPRKTVSRQSAEREPKEYPGFLSKPEEPRQLRTPSPAKKITATNDTTTDFIMSEREQEILNKVHTSLRKLSPERKEKSPSREQSPTKTTTSLQDLDIISTETIQSEKITNENLKEIIEEQTTITSKVPRPSQLKDDKPKEQKSSPSKPSSRNVSPIKRTTSTSNANKLDKTPESPTISRSFSPKKPISNTERPQSPQQPKASGIKPREQIPAHLTRKPTPATLSTTRIERLTTDVKKTNGVIKQSVLSKTTNKSQPSPIGKPSEPDTKHVPTSKGTKGNVSPKKDYVTRTASDIAMKPKKTASPQRMKSKPEIQVSDMSTKTPKYQKPIIQEPYSKLPAKPKSATSLNTSIDEDDIIIDVQQSKSSRENSPDRICPTPINLNDDVGVPRFPDEVSEPDDDFVKRTHHTIHETESVVDDIVEICEDEELFIKKSDMDVIIEQDDSLLSVNDKVNKFTSKIHSVKKPKDATMSFRETESRVHSDFFDENLKSDECLLSVSEKVNKFAKGPRVTKDSRSPSRKITDEYDRDTVYTDDYTKLSVNDKAHLFVETAENVKVPKVKSAQKVERPDLSNIEESLKSDDCLLSVSDKVNKFIKTAEQYITETQEVDEKETRIREKHEKILKQIVDEDVEDICDTKETVYTKKTHAVDDIDKEPIHRSDDSLKSLPKELKPSQAQVKDYISPTTKPTDRVPAVKITTLRSSEAVKKAKALFENIATTQKTTPKETSHTTKTTKLTDIGVIKKSPKTDSTTVLHPSVENVSPQVPDVDDGVDMVPHADRPTSGTLTKPKHPYIDEKPRSSPNRLSAKSPEIPRSKSPMRQSVEVTTTKTVLSRYPAATRAESPRQRPESPRPRTESPRQRSDSDKPEKLPGYLRPTKTSQIKEESKVVEETEVSSRRGSGKFGVELRRTSVERSTVSSERRRSVEHHQPCIEDIFDLDLLEQMLEKVVGYEQRRRIRAQIRVAKNQREHVTESNTSTRTTKQTTTVSKTRSPERKVMKSPERGPKSTPQKTSSPDRQNKSTPQKTIPDRSQPKEPITNGRAKEPSKMPSATRQRPQSPEKPAPKSTLAPKTPTRQPSPDKRRTASPNKVTPKPKGNRFSEYASAYMKKVGLNEADKIKVTENKTKKTDDTRKAVNYETQQTTVQEFSTTRNFTERTSSKDVIEIVQTNGNRSPSPEQRQSSERKVQFPEHKTQIPERKAQSPERRLYSPDQKAQSPDRKVYSPIQKAKSPERLHQRTPSPDFKRSKSNTVKETVIKTVHDIEKKIPSKPVQEEKPSWVTNRNLKKITSESRTFSSKKIESEKPKYRAPSPSKIITKPTDVITSSYGPGPLDADGKPLFGIKALRNGATNFQVKGTVIRQEFHSHNGGAPEGTVSVTAYSSQPEDLERLLAAQGTQPASRLHGLSAITTTKKFGGDTGNTFTNVHTKEDRASLEQFTHHDRRVEHLENQTYDSRSQDFGETRIEEITSPARRIEAKKEVKQDRNDRSNRREEKVSEVKRQKVEEKRERMEKREDKKTVRQSSVKSLTEKYIKSANDSGKSDRAAYPKAGLILRTTTMRDSVSSDDAHPGGLQRADSDHSVCSMDDTVVSTTTERTEGGVRTTTTRTSHHHHHHPVTTHVTHHEPVITTKRTVISHEPVITRTVVQEPVVTRVTQGRQGTTVTTERSFLDSTSKVTGVQDILTRMKNADIVIQEGDSCEDSEARALLNKFLGATVLMAGMQGYVQDQPDARLTVTQESVRTSSGGGKVSTRSVQELDLDQCWDEGLLKKLLEECTDYEQRRRLRARIRTLMAEQEACASAVTEALGAAPAAGEAGDEAREEEEVTVTSSVRRDSSDKTVSSSTTTRTSKVVEMTRSAPKPVSPFAKFRQLEKQNSTNSPKM